MFLEQEFPKEWACDSTNSQQVATLGSDVFLLPQCLTDWRVLRVNRNQTRCWNHAESYYLWLTLLTLLGTMFRPQLGGAARAYWNSPTRSLLVFDVAFLLQSKIGRKQKDDPGVALSLGLSNQITVIPGSVFSFLQFFPAELVSFHTHLIFSLHWSPPSLQQKRSKTQSQVLKNWIRSLIER